MLMEVDSMPLLCMWAYINFFIYWLMIINISWVHEKCVSRLAFGSSNGGRGGKVHVAMGPCLSMSLEATVEGVEALPDKRWMMVITFYSFSNVFCLSSPNLDSTLPALPAPLPLQLFTASVLLSFKVNLGFLFNSPSCTIQPDIQSWICSLLSL